MGRRQEAEAHPEVETDLALGSQIELDITSLAAEGDGVGRYGNLAVFVPQAAPGDRLLVRVNVLAARHVRAAIVRVLSPAADRTAPPCPIYQECGGCTWQHLAYPTQLEWKRTIVVEALRRLGQVRGAEELVRPVLPADPPWRYRHKMAVPFAPPLGRGKPVQAGFFAPRSHRIVPMESCLIQHPLLDRVLAETLTLVSAFGVPAYDERTRRGALRHLLARVSSDGAQVLVALVTAQDAFPWGRALAEGLMARVPGCVGVVQNINTAPGNAILGRQTRPLAGNEHLLETLDGLRFLISAPSFFQVSPAQAARLYRVAVGQARLTATDRALDLYAGVGTLSLFLAREAAAVDAVEEVPEAVRDGRRNAELNTADNLRFHQGLVERVLPALVRAGLRPDVAVLDPPRRGVDQQVLAVLGTARPRRIVYVSCNPATLARDVRLLAGSGYALVEVRPVDMFPQTAHVECSALLELGHS